jgi:diguanylate cyclase (GGDEF)-like protein
MRKVTAVALLVGVVLLAVGPLAIASSMAQQRQQNKALQTQATQVAAAFTSYFERARSLDLLLSQNPALHQDPGPVTPEANDAANRALRYLEQLYPGAIGEACLIDDQGREIARVTRGVPAPIDELSTEEAENAFFGATFALDPGEVYQAAPYVSADTQTWVISNSTPIAVGDGRSLLVHFEVSLDSFAAHLTTGSGEHSAIVDLATGRTILSDDTALPRSEALADESEFPVFVHSSVLGTAGGPSRSIEADGVRLAVSPIPSTPGNANRWAVVQWSSRDAGVLPVWVGAALAATGACVLLLFILLLRRQHNALRLAARRDHLTNMANRRGLEEALEEALAASQRTGERIGVLMLDLDGFKQINDTLGHDRGDVVLQEIGRRLTANTLEYDTAGRMGGDEYAVVLRRLHEGPDVATVATRLREALVRPVEVDGVARFVGVSIGAAVCPDHGTVAAELIRAADSAMYRAKRGREGIGVYEMGTSDGATGSCLAAELLIAIEQDQITLAYQPEHDIDSGRVVSVEALARWLRAGSEHVPPSEFVPLAEETGLIRQLTLLTLRKALDEVTVWRDAGSDVPVSVNLSARLVTDRVLPVEVNTLLTERGLSGDSLILEVTETALVGDVASACAVLGQLRSIGVRIELDDFGSGYASTRALRELPLDGIKVDRDLVNDLSPSGRSLVAATIEVGKVLDLYVVAEGIEDEDGLGRMRSLGVDIAQGYHLGRPMSRDAIRLVLAEARPEDAAQPQLAGPAGGGSAFTGSR